MNFQSICRLRVSGVSTWRSQSAHGGNYRLQVHAGGAERRLWRTARRSLFRSEACRRLCCQRQWICTETDQTDSVKVYSSFSLFTNLQLPTFGANRCEEAVEFLARRSCVQSDLSAAERCEPRYIRTRKGKRGRPGSTGNSKRGMEITNGTGINAEAKTTILDYRLHSLDRQTVWKRLILEVRSRIEPQWLLW